MCGMFKDAHSFNEASLGSWDTSSVSNMSDMFSGAVRFNQPLSWGVRMLEGAISLLTLSLWTLLADMSSMFEGAISFAEPLNSWIGSAATNSSRSASIFASATAFWNKYSCYSAVDGPVDTCVCANPDFCVTDASFLSSVSACLAESPPAWFVSDLRQESLQNLGHLVLSDTSKVTIWTKRLRMQHSTVIFPLGIRAV